MKDRSVFPPGEVRSGLITLAIPALLVLALIILLIQIQASTEAAAASLVNLLPIGFAFAAGMVASVNPCGFLLLPTYLTYQLGLNEEGYEGRTTFRKLGNALLLGVIATLGFVVVLSAAGVIVGAGGRWLVNIFPYAGLAIGFAMVGLGAWLIIGKVNLSLLAASRLTVSQERSWRNVFLFGMVYAVGSLSCTLPIFLVVVGSGLGSGSFAASLGSFVSYALGMGVVLIAATIASGLLRNSFIHRLRRLIPHIQTASAMFLVGAGAYLIYYWVYFADAIL
jgi:cytochrome c biogenesis protein CcdA